MASPFVVEECSLVRCATGRRCSNLRELLDAVRSASANVLEHHMMRCALEDHFELYEFPNDLARWCWDALGDQELAERLAIVNPYSYPNVEELRDVLIDSLEDHIWALERVPWSRPGLELHLVESRLVAFDTGESFSSLAGLAETLPRLSRRTLFYHFHEAFRRNGVDDFSAWLAQNNAPPELVGRIRALDFYFLNLSQLREQFLDATCAFLAEPRAVMGGRSMNMLDRYEEVAGRHEIVRLRRLAERLAGKRIVHVNSTKVGGGVAEILGWMIPMMVELGIDARWEVIQGNADFYRVTKAFHNGLQGIPTSLRAADYKLHLDVNETNARNLDLEADVVFVHDPQPIFLPRFTARGKVGRWIWRCHVDASRPNRAVWQHLADGIRDYEATVFSMPAFTRPLRQSMFLIPPSIDPLSEKNRMMDDAERVAILERLGIDPERPILLQVSRFDRFKDPLGVIEAFDLVRPVHPELQLVLVGGPADDDPEGPEVLNQVLERAGDNPDLKVLLLPADSHLEINALQRSAVIVLQKSLKEGFGLTVTEALWKGKPVIGGATGGIALQIHDYHTGFLVHSAEGAAYRIRYLLRYSDKRQRIGATGHDFVRENFLLTRHLRDYFSMLLWLDNPGSGVLAA